VDLEDLEPARKASWRGKRSAPSGPCGSGRYVRAEKLEEGTALAGLAVDATLRAAALRRASEGGAGEPEIPFAPRREDLRRKLRAGAASTLVVFAVDASDSMGAERRMAAAKGAALALLAAAYRKRYRVALVAFRDRRARVLLPPVASCELVRQRLRRLSTGGATPLADGLVRSWRLIRTERLKRPRLRALLVLLSDGEANVPLDPGMDCLAEACALGRRIRREAVRSVLIDIRPQASASAQLLKLAAALGGSYHHPRTLGSAAVVEAVLSQEGP